MIIPLARIISCAFFATSLSVFAEDSILYQPENYDRTVLVGFKDNEISRKVATVSATDSYRKRGQYSSSSWSKRVAENVASEYLIEEVSDWPITELGIHCVIYQIPKESSVDKVMMKLSADNRFELVQKMHLYRTRAVSYTDPYFHLQSGIRSMDIEMAHVITTGKNVKIGIIDTGVDLEHPDLEGQVIKNENFVAGFSENFSSDRHGTAVAGVIAARMNNGAGIVGVAPNASLIALKACWPTSKDQLAASCNTYSLALAINAAIKAGVDILNLSLSGPEDPLLASLLKRAAEKNIVLVAADPGEHAEPKSRFPASLQQVIAVQSQNNSASSLIDADLTTVAPSEAILTTVPHGSYDFISGSSLAAAHISGVVALLLQLKSDLSLPQTREVLSKARIINEGNNKNNTILSVNANTAISELCNITDCSY